MSDTTKGIEFRVNLNTAEANKQIADLQQKLQSISKTQGYSDKAKSLFGDGTQMSKESQKIFQDQQTADTKFLREKFNSLQKNKELADKILTRSLEGNKQEQKDLERQLQLREKLFTIQKQQVDIAEKAKQVDPTLAGFAGQAGGVGGPPQAGGIPVNRGSTSGGMGSLLSGMGGSAAAMMAGGSLMAIIGGIKKAGDFISYATSEQNQRATREQGSIIGARTQFSGITDMASGRAAGVGMWNPARQKARSDAEEAYSGSKFTERMLGADEEGHLPGQLLAATPWLGEWLAPEAHAGIYGKGTNEEARARYKEQQIAANSQTNLEAERAKNPMIGMATDYFESNRGRMLQAQQMSGMNDQSMFGMLKGGGLYTEDQKYGMMQGVAGAGGSSAQMRNNIEGLNLQRGYGIQNAAGIMGQLSSGLGGGQTAGDSTTKRILADAFSIGLDSSHFSRETEKFLQQSAQFISDSGARTVAEQQSVAAMMTGGLTGTSMKDVEAAGTGRTAAFSAMGEGATPMSQAMQVSSLRFGATAGISDSDRNYLVSLNPSQFLESDPQIKSMMVRTGKSFEQLKESYNKAKTSGSTLTPQQVSNQKELGTLQAKYQGSMNDESAWQKRIEDAGGPDSAAGKQIAADRDRQSALIGESATTLQGQGMFSGLKGQKLTAAAQQYQNLANSGMIDKYRTEHGGMLMRPDMPEQEQGLAVQAQKAQAAGEQSLSSEYIDKYAKDYQDSSDNMIKAANAYVESLNKITAAHGGTIPMSTSERTTANNMNQEMLQKMGFSGSNPLPGTGQVSPIRPDK